MGITFNNSLATKPKFKPMVMKEDEIKKEKGIFMKIFI